jgi:predicted ribosomally synthesized peptide with nif11-like leader
MQSLADFQDRLEHDASFAHLFTDANSPEAIVAIARHEGYDITEEEVMDYQRSSNSDTMSRVFPAFNMFLARGNQLY